MEEEHDTILMTNRYLCEKSTENNNIETEKTNNVENCTGTSHDLGIIMDIIEVKDEELSDLEKDCNDYEFDDLPCNYIQDNINMTVKTFDNRFNSSNADRILKNSDKSPSKNCEMHKPNVSCVTGMDSTACCKRKKEQSSGCLCWGKKSSKISTETGICKKKLKTSDASIKDNYSIYEIKQCSVVIEKFLPNNMSPSDLCKVNYNDNLDMYTISIIKESLLSTFEPELNKSLPTTILSLGIGVQSTAESVCNEMDSPRSKIVFKYSKKSALAVSEENGSNKVSCRDAEWNLLVDNSDNRSIIQNDQMGLIASRNVNHSVPQRSVGFKKTAGLKKNLSKVRKYPPVYQKRNETKEKNYTALQNSPQMVELAQSFETNIKQSYELMKEQKPKLSVSLKDHSSSESTLIKKDQLGLIERNKLNRTVPKIFLSCKKKAELSNMIENPPVDETKETNYTASQFGPSMVELNSSYKPIKKIILAESQENPSLPQSLKENVQLSCERMKEKEQKLPVEPKEPSLADLAKYLKNKSNKCTKIDLDILDDIPPFIQEVLKCDNIQDGFINEDLIFVLSLLPDLEEMADSEKLQFQLRVIETITDVLTDPELKL